MKKIKLKSNDKDVKSTHKVKQKTKRKNQKEFNEEISFNELVFMGWW